MTGTSVGWSLARVAALVLVVVAATPAWGSGHGFRDGDQGPIWMEPGTYQGPPGATLDQAQVEAIAARARQLTF